MNTATHSAAAVASEIWAATLKRYCSVAGIVLLYYDWLLTLDDEVCLIFSSLYCLTACSQMRLVWLGALSWPTALYYITRYLTITGLTFSNYR